MNKEQFYKVLESSPNFPKVPSELSNIIIMLQEPKRVNIDELVDKIMAISGLEERILIYLNSEIFRLKKQITSLREAIIYLGMNTMQVIVLATIIRYLFPADGESVTNRKKVDYLKHTIGTAVASCSIAEYLNEYDKFEIFTQAMLHDIGVVIIDNCYHEKMEEILTIMERGNAQIVAEKIALGGLHHCDVGAWLCDKLNLPNNIKEVISYHHWPTKQKAENRLIHIIYAGDYISTKYYEKLLKVNVDYNLNFNNTLNIPKEIVENIAISLPEEVDRVYEVIKKLNL